MKAEQAAAKRPYEKPTIIYSRQVEALAATCASVLLGTSSRCRLSVPVCDIVFGA